MYRVLIVEDEMLVRLGLKNSIEWNKFDMTIVSDVTNGQEAWEAYEKEQPDLIITDIRMPVMNGMELIQRIREKDKDTIIVILSCIEEFDLVRKAMSYGVSDYILKLTMTEEEIEAVLKNVQDKLINSQKHHVTRNIITANTDVVKEKLLKDLLFYHICTPEDFCTQTVRLGLKLHKERLLLCMLEIDDFDRLQTKLDDEKGLLIKLTMLNILNEILNNYKRGEVFYDNDIHYVLIFSFQDCYSEQALLQELFTILNNVKATINTFFDASISFGISSIQNGFDALEKMYREAKKALEQKFVCGTGTFFISDQEQKEGTIVDKLQSLRSLPELDKLMLKDNLMEYQERIDRVIDTLPTTRIHVQEFFYQLLNWTASSISIHGEINTTVISYNQQISRCDTLDGMVLLFKKFITNINKNAHTNKIISKDISEAVKYIKHNYAEEINLQKVAEHVKLSPAYLSNLFKKDLQVNFTEYLNEVRIKNAKELLADSYFKAYEISEKVGFSDNAYFCRVFRKLTGVSPNEYRKQRVCGWKEDDDE